MSQPVIHLSGLLGSPLLDRAGDRLGRVGDVIVRLDEAGFPPVTGLRGRIGGRELFVPTDRIAELRPDGALLSGEQLDLRRFDRRAGEVLLGEDVLGRKLIDVQRARLVTAHEIELTCVDGWWRVLGIDPNRRVRLRRLWPGARRRPGQAPSPPPGTQREDGDARATPGSDVPGPEGPDPGGPITPWTQLEPFVGHVPSSRLSIRHRKLAQLHPAEIADLVEAASHDQGEEIIQAVGQDRELEADVFEELDDEHQVEFLRERSDAEAAKLIGRMEPDDAVDLITELDQQRREGVLALLPATQQRRLRKLLGYNPSTAGGLMSPDVVSVPQTTNVREALERVRARRDVGEEASSAVFLTDSDGRLSGWLHLVTLLRADPATRLEEVADRELKRVRPDADLPELANLMSDYNLVALPVVDDDERLVGVVTVDDLLEDIIPTQWRWRHRVSQSD